MSLYLLPRRSIRIENERAKVSIGHSRAGAGEEHIITDANERLEKGSLRGVVGLGGKIFACDSDTHTVDCLGKALFR